MNVPGQADHRKSLWKEALQFLGYARKAVVAFIVGGGGAAFGQAIATFDFSDLTLRNLWTGIGAGVVSAFVVYWTANKAKIMSEEEQTAG